MTTRGDTRPLRLGALQVGGGAPVSVQTMTKTDTRDVSATVAQIRRVADLGCDIVRLAVPDMTAAEALADIRRLSPPELPLVADIHFDYRLALAAVASGIDGLRINPGNIGGSERIRAVVQAARPRSLPIRIGVNGGSLERDILERHGAATPEALVESAMRHVALLEEGIGDTIRISLTDTPEQEVRVGIELLRAMGLRSPGPSVTSCPTCGRACVDVAMIARAIEDELESYYRGHPDARRPRVAVMGCAVNGPGEARDADIGIAGGKGKFLLFRAGQPAGTVDEAEAVAAVMRMVKEF